ncbi:MAG: hypothetical protein E7609_02530 [Ruminococcaceae bacterium]|nr:hypothetical protein [Oscillospiraceae bacterium]
MEAFWGSDVWGLLTLFAVLMISLLVANALKRSVRLLKVSLIPTSVLAGAILLFFAGIWDACFKTPFFETAVFGGRGYAYLETITYHALALGFIASTFKGGKTKMTKKRTGEIFNTGVTTVATYLLQGVFGLGITMLACFLLSDFFAAAGVLLPFGYGQGTGQAMNYGGIYEHDYGFVGGKSFGLTIAALGFLSASLGGVIHLNILRHKKKIAVFDEDATGCGETVESQDEIPMQGSIDKLTVQVALVSVSYLVTYLIMFLLGELLPGMKATVYGFNFLLGVLAAVLVKAVLRLFKRMGTMKKEHINDFLMTRVSNVCFDIMVVAGIAAIRLGLLDRYWGVIAILGVVGLVVTYIYNRIVAKVLFPEYVEEQFLMMYGMLTGTASTGTILLREIDGEFKTPAADNMVYQNFPAIAFGFPMMFLATFAPGNELLTLIIFALFFAVLNIILFRSKIFGKRNKK